MEDNETIEISNETAEVALRELEMLIDRTADEDPDPLQDDVFRARDELRREFGEYSHDINIGDVFDTENGPIKVLGIQSCGDLIVTDPTESHPQSDRAGTWTVERSGFEKDLNHGTVERSALNVVNTESDSENEAEVVDND